MVSAWATANAISLGQVVTDEKSNEITAIPKLLKMLALRGAIVTIDAMGCQTEIARKIVAGRGDYLLNDKGNQPTLRDGIEQDFASHLDDMPSPHPVQSSSTERKARGRTGSRWSYVCTAPKSLPDRDRWPGLKAIGMVIGNTTRDGKDYIDVRYYILSKKLSAKSFTTAVASHWAIGNQFHWQLDVTFRDDHCRIRKGHADANFSTLRRSALSMLKKEKTKKLGIKNKRLSAGWDEPYLLKVLCGT